MQRVIAFREWFWSKPIRPAFALSAVCLLMLPAGQCQTVSVDRPCGVIRDDLKTVKGKTPADQQRIDVHHARGRAAGCW